ncbi:DoxX family protein [Hymenobacter wooponensis]|uniref:DoxX family protein n=1 Tax=Hymenobacter wooponensis TaxID=1525360 RepID=A0A4Z0MTL5_9BACT|nr:DoxX family protein [Hymenobacter wooponensis]TGD82789.1 DoxX family protein [Hymenobacter wooponensis]
MKRISLFYWLTTGLLSVAMLGSGLGDVALAAPIVENMQHLGFPVALVPFLGVLKILGVLTILLVPREHLRVGAYAGFLFYSLGAVAVHVGAHDPVAAALPALVLLLLTVASYWLWTKRLAQPTTSPDTATPALA